MSLTILHGDPHHNIGVRDKRVAVFEIDIIEASDIQDACFIFEIEKHNPFPTTGRGHSQSQWISNDHQMVTYGSLLRIEGGEYSFGSNPFTLVAHHVMLDIKPQQTPFDDRSLRSQEVSDIVWRQRWWYKEWE